MESVIAAEPPEADDVRALIEAHHHFSHQASGPANSFALRIDELDQPAITLFTCRSADDEALLLGIGALATLDAGHGEIKTMHTTSAARGFGLARAMIEHLIDTAQGRGMTRLSLETGTQDAFEPARNLYASAGFTECPPFGKYIAGETSVCMTRTIEPPAFEPLNLESIIDSEESDASDSDD